jgi:hypothetical protein
MDNYAREMERQGLQLDTVQFTTMMHRATYHRDWERVLRYKAESESRGIKLQLLGNNCVLKALYEVRERERETVCALE